MDGMRASDAELRRRALAAWYATGSSGRPRASVAEVDGRAYVVLRERGTVAAVYRVRAYDGVLRRMRRWPRALNGPPSRGGHD